MLVSSFPYIFLNRRSWPLPSRWDCSPPFGGRISVSVPWNSSSWPSSRSGSKPHDRTIETDIEKDIISFLKKNTFLLKWLIFVGFCWGIFLETCSTCNESRHPQRKWFVGETRLAPILECICNYICLYCVNMSEIQLWLYKLKHFLFPPGCIALSSSDGMKGFESHMSLWRRVEANKSCVGVSSM